MYHFIVNLHSRSGQGRFVWDAIKAELGKHGMEYHVHFTLRKFHAAKIAAKITADDEPHTLVVLGGDGSLNETLNGIKDLSKVTLGYIPSGSGNDFARGTGIPNKFQEALQVILKPTHYKALDVGLISYGEKKRRFVVSSGIGYDADICHAVSVSKLKLVLNKLNLGKLAYIGMSLDRLYHAKPGKMTLTFDGERKVEFSKTYFAAAMNLPYEGGGCKFCPDALGDDQFLDIVVIADIPKYRALFILPTVFSGKHTKMKGVHIFRCKRVDIESVKPLPIHADGECVFLQRRISMSLDSQHINVIIP